jgi:2,7-dihydroxy-5-methyl-1-naphthoate 7-O-methyltransferase
MGMEDLTDLMTPWCVHTVATLRIAEHLDGGIDTIDALATAAACDPRALHNVLGHLVIQGLFEEPEPGRFALTDAGRGLLGAPFLDLDGIGGRFAGAWETIPAYVKTGKPAYEAKFGRAFWDDLAAHPSLAQEFDDLIGPGGHAAPDPHFDLPWDEIETVVDVGGGIGTLLNEILAAYPHVRGTLVDFPGTVQRAEGDFEKRGQSFFDPLPAGADLYILRSVLNDWADEETDAILETVAAAMHDRSRLIVSGGVAPDDAPRRLMIEMVLLGGTTDSLDAFTARARSAGLHTVRSGEQADGRFYVELTRS